MESKQHLMVIDDILEVSSAQLLANTLMSTSFPWYYQRSSTGYDDPQGLDRPWLFHVFLYEYSKSESPYRNLINSIFEPLYDFLKREPEQVRASMEIQQTPGLNFYHRDRLYEHFSCIYYVIDADGNTVFGRENPVEVKPQFNSIAIFSGSIDHCNRFPETKERCIINFIFDGPFPQHLTS